MNNQVEGCVSKGPWVGNQINCYTICNGALPHVSSRRQELGLLQIRRQRTFSMSRSRIQEGSYKRLSIFVPQLVNLVKYSSIVNKRVYLCRLQIFRDRTVYRLFTGLPVHSCVTSSKLVYSVTNGNLMSKSYYIQSANSLIHRVFGVSYRDKRHLPSLYLQYLYSCRKNPFLRTISFSDISV